MFRALYTAATGMQAQQTNLDTIANNLSNSSTAGNSGNGASSSTAGVDQTRFSFDPTRVQSLQAQVLAQPEIRDAKVRALQQAIGNGEYSVPASHVAAALINELGGGAQG